MKVISLNIGKSQEITWNKKTINTGIYKYPVEQPIYLEEEAVQKDCIADRKHHGGIDQAVYGFGHQHYAYYKEIYPNLDWNYGMFGENITFDQLEETALRSGSVFQLGEAKIEVTKPRQPCYKLGIRFGDQEVIKTMWNSTKSGVYFKVVKPGKVALGDQLIPIIIAGSQPTIAEIYHEKRLRK